MSANTLRITIGAFLVLALVAGGMVAGGALGIFSKADRGTPETASQEEDSWNFMVDRSEEAEFIRRMTDISFKMGVALGSGRLAESRHEQLTHFYREYEGSLKIGILVDDLLAYARERLSLSVQQAVTTTNDDELADLFYIWSDLVVEFYSYYGESLAFLVRHHAEARKVEGSITFTEADTQEEWEALEQEMIGLYRLIGNTFTEIEGRLTARMEAPEITETSTPQAT